MAGPGAFPSRTSVGTGLGDGMAGPETACRWHRVKMPSILNILHCSLPLLFLLHYWDYPKRLGLETAGRSSGVEPRERNLEFTDPLSLVRSLVLLAPPIPPSLLGLP